MRVKVSLISYLNTLPFSYGLRNHPVANQIEIIEATPSQAAAALIKGESDIGIIPSAVVPLIGVERVVSDFCIGAEREVESVLICSNVPIEHVKELFLDIDSRTSVMLAKYLLKEHWGITPQFVSFDAGREQIDYTNSYLLIGDKAIINSPLFKYKYDLAGEWVKKHSLPFVFACWTSSRKLEPAFVEQFNEALDFGINNIERAIEVMPHNFDPLYAKRYLTHNISYNLTDNKRKALELFWEIIK